MSAKERTIKIGFQNNKKNEPNLLKHSKWYVHFFLKNDKKLPVRTQEFIK